MRPITPIVNGAHSYAVAWASKRDDGNPYEYSSKLQDLGLSYDKGYTVTVSLQLVEKTPSNILRFNEIFPIPITYRICSMVIMSLKLIVPITI